MESVINKLSRDRNGLLLRLCRLPRIRRSSRTSSRKSGLQNYDADLEAETAKRIEEITTKLHSTTDADQKKTAGRLPPELLSSLDAYYEQNHGALSTQIYENIIRK